jgi:hypothetical protein
VQAKPGWLTKIEAQLANAAARAATAVEMTAPGRAWEAQPSTGNAYAAAYGAWGGDGLGAQGWIDKLNRRTW